MRVLVTGGAGLIGLALRRLLPGAGHDVVATDITTFGRDDPELVLADLRDAEALERLVVARGIDAIVHSGGISGPVMAKNDPLRVVDVNIGVTAHLLDISRRHALRRFVLLSSHVVYGDVGPGTIDEDTPLHPTTSYAASKVAGEALVESYAHEWGVSGLSLRVTRVYGPFRRDNCFLRRIILDEASGATSTIPCDPGYAYHYVHVDDVAGAIAAALAAPAPRFYAYNVTSGEVVTMPQVVAAALAALPDADVRMVPGADDAPEVQMDFSLARIRDDLGWTPARDLRRGFGEYLASVRANGLEQAT